MAFAVLPCFRATSLALISVSLIQSSLVRRAGCGQVGVGLVSWLAGGQWVCLCILPQRSGELSRGVKIPIAFVVAGDGGCPEDWRHVEAAADSVGLDVAHRGCYPIVDGKTLLEFLRAYFFIASPAASQFRNSA